MEKSIIRAEIYFQKRDFEGFFFSGFLSHVKLLIILYLTWNLYHYNGLQLLLDYFVYHSIHITVDLQGHIWSGGHVVGLLEEGGCSTKDFI